MEEVEETCFDMICSRRGGWSKKNGNRVHTWSFLFENFGYLPRVTCVHILDMGLYD